jgi:uncharacterized protein (TIRG00374 family)
VLRGSQHSVQSHNVGRIARVAIAVGLTLIVLWKADPGRVLAVARNASTSWILLAVALVLVDRALMAYRWLVLLRALDPAVRPPFRAVMRVFFVSTFVGTFLPSIGGDLVRAYSLSAYGVSGAQAAASVLMDRVLGVASLVLVGVAGMIAGGRLLAPTAAVVALVAAFGVCAVVGTVVFGTSAGDRLAAYVPGERLRRLVRRMVEAARRYARHPADLSNVLAGSIAVQVLRIVQAWCLGVALGIHAGIVVYFAAIPLILLVMLLPVTINGLGTSQLAFVWFFSQVGVAEAPAFALSVLFVALGIVGNLPGALLYATGGGKGAIPVERHTHMPAPE